METAGKNADVGGGILPPSKLEVSGDQPQIQDKYPKILPVSQDNSRPSRMQ